MDTPADGAAEKAHFLESLGTPDAGSSVHFLTGQQAAITDLAAPLLGLIMFACRGRMGRWTSLPIRA